MHAECAECANIPAVDDPARPVTRRRGYLTDEERGEFGAWLITKMGAMSFEQLAEEMRELGEAHKAAYYRAMASGAKKPGRAVRKALEERFGEAAKMGAQAPDQSNVAAAIRDQTLALRELAQAIREAFTVIDHNSQARGAEIMRRLADIAFEVGVPQPEREPADTAASTRAEGAPPDRGSVRRLRGTRRPKIAPPRPSWDESDPPPIEKSRTGSGLL